ncbi:YceI family protein [Sphingomonas cavernae]|uniref:Lipid/polyisoprenoid-binding YceI-like domain-containing protein n=1 Tax=Sphingomonas cavernae TaxID=2320861 RepID=A0A418WNH5_9SPHN|nr:YceI family protein [Sphingomonas cavernae]RJF91549.1 hypothetical protein D3876_12090 [Sphingomonas cavernae]
MPPTRYSYAAITLHWLIALALAFQISLGWALEGPNSPELFERYQLHKSVGVTILVLTLIRLAIRFTVPRPVPSEGPAWARTLANIVHWLFYAVMIIGPLAGWVIVSTSKIQVPTLLYGVIPLPHLPVSRALHDPAEVIHESMAWLAVGLFVLHIAGALRHQWLLGKPELQRMIPFARGRAIPAAIGALLLILAGLTAGKMAFPDRARTAAPAAVPVTPAPVAPPTPAEIVQAPAENVQEAVPVAEAQPLADWTIAQGGRLGFTARWNGEAINGTFGRWRASIRFSPDMLDKSNIRVTVDLASAGTGDGQRDDALKGSDFFNTEAHPGAVFTSRDIRHRDGDRYEARGTLDLRGISKPATLRFTLRIDGDKASVSGTSRIDRTAFGVGQGEWADTEAIAAGVDIAFSFTATRNAE